MFCIRSSAGGMSFALVKYTVNSHQLCSVFSGLAAMVLLAPVPAYFGTKMRKVQVERMKKVILNCSRGNVSYAETWQSDARVQSVTECMQSPLTPFGGTLIFCSSTVG